MVIKILDKSTAEQIAAGEVIENPASVVKELVENAMDAGTTKIEVTIEGGGKRLLTVTDNGCGINPPELPLAFQRFATSKLTALDDLDHLSSLGFRGEALPSIAAVSRIKMTTRSKDSIAGAQITISGGELEGEEEVGAPPGTRVEVRDLFYNTPGRLKFLRADNVETTRISTLLSELALTHPEVAFTLKSGKKTMFSSSGDGVLLHVIGALYGRDPVEAMLEVNRKDSASGCTLSGFISAPHMTRSTRRWITLVVNGRLIRNPMLINALERGYGDLLPSQRHPLAVLNLSIPPEMIDVNVHPAKIEIRFQKPEIVKGLVYKAVKLSLQENKNIPQWPDSIDTPGYTPAQYSKTSKSHHRQDRFESFPSQARENSRNWQHTPLSATEANSREDIIKRRGEEGGDPLRAAPRGCYLIGQFLQSYLVVQEDEKLLLIDQHAAHERVIYNQLQKQSQSKSEGNITQLTLPLNLELPPAWRDRLPVLLPLLQETGFQLEPVSEDCYAIKAVPFMLRENVNRAQLYDLLEQILTADQESADEYRDKIYKTIACHRSIKAKQPLSRDEMEQLLEEWENTPLARYCPHGRPTVISFDKAQLDKSFHRSEGN